MALLTHDGLDGLLMAVESARLSEEQLANANRLLGVAVVRAPRTARVVKRRVEHAEEPVRARQAAAKRQEFTAGVPSANFRALIAEKRAKETRCAPAKRQEFTAAVPSNFALVRLGQHLGHSARQLPRKR